MAACKGPHADTSGFGFDHEAHDKQLRDSILMLYGDGSLNGQEAGALLMLMHTANVELYMHMERSFSDTIEAELEVKVKLRRRMHRAPDPIPFTEDVDFTEVKRQQQLPPGTKLLTDGQQ